jgi:hypothetical protein
MLLGMVKATIEDLVLPHCSSKEPDEVRRRGCIEHTFGKEEWVRFEQRTSFQWILSKHAQFRSR